MFQLFSQRDREIHAKIISEDLWSLSLKTQEEKGS